MNAEKARLYVLDSVEELVKYVERLEERNMELEAENEELEAENEELTGDCEAYLHTIHEYEAKYD